jgi:hypothetical protein
MFATRVLANHHRNPGRQTQRNVRDNEDNRRKQSGGEARIEEVSTAEEGIAEESIAQQRKARTGATSTALTHPNRGWGHISASFT